MEGSSTLQGKVALVTGASRGIGFAIARRLGAAGAMEAVATVRTLETGIIHPTINQETPDPECDLDYVPNTARRAAVRIALSNSFGFGGQNACLILRAAAD